MPPETTGFETPDSRALVFSADGRRIDASLHRRSLEIVGYPSVMLSVHEQAFLVELMHPVGEPRLAVQMAKNNEDLNKPVDISVVHQQVKEKLAPTVLDGHLIRLGQGKSTWYGMLREDSDQARLEFARDGMDSVDSTTRKALIKQRRKQPFLDLIELINEGEDESRFTRNKKLIRAGAATVAITIGSAATVYVIKHKKK